MKTCEVCKVIHKQEIEVDDQGCLCCQQYHLPNCDCGRPADAICPYPFDADVNNDHTLHAMCDACIDMRSDEI